MRSSAATRDTPSHTHLNAMSNFPWFLIFRVSLFSSKTLRIPKFRQPSATQRKRRRYHELFDRVSIAQGVGGGVCCCGSYLVRFPGPRRRPPPRLSGSHCGQFPESSLHLISGTNGMDTCGSQLTWTSAPSQPPVSEVDAGWDRLGSAGIHPGFRSTFMCLANS